MNRGFLLRTSESSRWRLAFAVVLAPISAYALVAARSAPASADIPATTTHGLEQHSVVMLSVDGGAPVEDAGQPVTESRMPPGSQSVSDSPGARTWRLVAGKHWQIVAPAGEPLEMVEARERNRGACGPGMIEVAGRMKQGAMLDELQLQACSRWIDHKWPERCAEYDRDKWLELSRDLPTAPMRFCIDRFEYPNKSGEYPIILVSWYEARDACKAEGKRLCTEDEWTFACEGEEARPYPNGYVRDRGACLNDRPWIKFADGALFSRASDSARQELDRLWQGMPSGARPLCRSPFGVYDMTGNIDEWTRSSIPGERPSVLKGGYWGPVRTRCRPATKAHDETHTFYQQGLRCCSDPPKDSSSAP